MTSADFMIFRERKYLIIDLNVVTKASVFSKDALEKMHANTLIWLSFIWEQIGAFRSNEFLENVIDRSY